MSDLPKTMRAWVFRKLGAPEHTLELEHAWPVPQLKQGEVLVRVHSAALNWGAYKFMTMSVLNRLTKRPSIPESDFAGTVVDCPGGAFEEGDRVCGSAIMDM